MLVRQVSYYILPIIVVNQLLNFPYINASDIHIYSALIDVHFECIPALLLHLSRSRDLPVVEVGYVRRSRPQYIAFTKHDTTFKFISHMLLHALGRYHEHQRADREKYINVLWDNIVPGDL